MHYSQKIGVLRDNEVVANQIRLHIHGAPFPADAFAPVLGKRIKSSDTFRDDAREWWITSSTHRVSLQAWDKWEATSGKKRPEEVLDIQLQQTSNMLAAFASRIDFRLKEAGR